MITVLYTYLPVKPVNIYNFIFKDIEGWGEDARKLRWLQGKPLASLAHWFSTTYIRFEPAEKDFTGKNPFAHPLREGSV